MRPVKKWQIGEVVREGVTITENYRPYSKALPLLLENIGSFCSYCEIFSTDLEVEHVISQNQAPEKETLWENYLLACGRCNGRDNKTNKPVDLNNIFMPHLHNTFLALEYCEGGFIKVNDQIPANEKQKAQALIDLIGLDKYPGNPKYNKLLPGDRRWENRRRTWEWAKLKLKDFEQGKLDAENLALFAYQRGSFSIWFTVFKNHQEVKQALIRIFEGTDSDCFGENCNRVPKMAE